MFSCKYSLGICLLATGSLGLGQNGAGGPQQDRVMIMSAKGPNMPMAVQFMGAEFNFDKLVKNAPYTADAVNETVQILADGNRITHKNTTSLARDSEGRTRREEQLGAVGPWSTGAAEAPKIVFINDPVAHTNYVLEPNHVARAMKMEGRNIATLKVMKDIDEAKAGAAGVTIARSGNFEADLPPLPPIAGAQNAFYKKLSAEQQNTKTEDLGQQAINGVIAKGTRTTTTIPAGQMGNERPLEIVNETWYSPELQTIVMSKRSDPRFGDTTYQLTNVQRAEPDPMLFQVPSDYKIEDAPKRVIQFHGNPESNTK